MRTLSHEDERKITDSAIEVTRLVDEGQSPNSAAITVAKQARLSPNFINLMAIGYNTGVVNHQRESSDNGILDKLADVPLIDPEQVLRGVYTDGVDELGLKVAHDHSLSAYAPLTQQEQLRPARADELSALKKVASDCRQRYSLQIDEREPSDAEKWHSRVQKVAELRETLRELRIQQLQLENNQLNSKLAELNSYYQGYPTVSTSQLQSCCAFLTEEDGRIAEAVISGITGQPASIKSARDIRIDWDQKPYKTVKDLVSIVKQAQDTRAMCRTVEFYIHQFDPAHVPTGLSPVKKAARKPEQFDILDDSVDKMAFLAPLSAALMTASREGKDRMDSLPPSQDPSFRAELNNIRAHTLLSELISGDDIIGSYDPEEVYQAYNELAPMYPTVVNNTGFMRPILRKRLAQGSLDPMELSELAKVEKNVHDISRTSQAV